MPPRATIPSGQDTSVFARSRNVGPYDVIENPAGDQQSTIAEVAALKMHINLTTWLQQQEAQAMAAKTQAALKAGEAKINMYA